MLPNIHEQRFMQSFPKFLKLIISENLLHDGIGEYEIFFPKLITIVKCMLNINFKDNT